MAKPKDTSKEASKVQEQTKAVSSLTSVGSSIIAEPDKVQFELYRVGAMTKVGHILRAMEGALDMGKVFVTSSFMFKDEQHDPLRMIARRRSNYKTTCSLGPTFYDKLGYASTIVHVQEEGTGHVIPVVYFAVAKQEANEKIGDAIGRANSALVRVIEREWVRK